ncbi:MAG: M36 family metallopeptidase [Allosphingosinicella sp.]
MPIAYIPNDPLLQQPVRQINPVQDRPANKVRFVVTGLPPAAVYPTASLNFVAWQSREAAFRTLDVFESICGPLPGWQGKPAMTRMQLIPNFDVDLNAYYTRQAIQFYEFPIGQQILYSGASSDVVAHETGHAILDSIRPQLWGVTMIEAAAFHEGFGDMIAILYALSAQQTRQQLLAGAGVLNQANFVETTAEALSDGVRRAIRPNHNAAAPRRARNNFQWVLPQTLPANGGPGALINEAHSLGQIVSGVYYDLIRNIFAAGAGSQANLWTACQKATLLAARAAAQAPIVPRLFLAWGRTMLLIDQQLHNGANAAHIKAAFAAHGLAVSASGFLAPQAPVAKAAPSASAKGAAMLTRAGKARVRQLLGLAQGTALSLRRLDDIGAGIVTEVAARARVDLSGLSERLNNVVADVPRPALVGESGGSTALLGSVQSEAVLSSEVRDFVEMLVRRGSIAFDGSSPARPSPNSGGAGFIAKEGAKTHAVARSGRQAVLERVAFACGCAATAHRRALR